jgi:hypothetical protein
MTTEEMSTIVDIGNEEDTHWRAQTGTWPGALPCA